MEFYFDFDLIPAVRMTNKGKWVSLRAREYIQNQEELAWLYQLQMAEKGYQTLPAKQELYIGWIIQRERLYTYDFDNGLKSLLDAAKGVVFQDDRYFTLDLGGMKRKGRACLHVWMGLVSQVDDRILAQIRSARK